MPRSQAVASGTTRDPLMLQVKEVTIGEGRTKDIRWADSFVFYGNLRVLWSIERWRTFRLEETINYEVETRYDEGITVGCRIRFEEDGRNRYFSIEAIIDENLRHRKMILGLVEKADKNT
mgnify:FL=1